MTNVILSLALLAFLALGVAFLDAYKKKEIPKQNVNVYTEATVPYYTIGTDESYSPAGEPGLFHPAQDDTIQNMADMRDLEPIATHDPYGDWEFPDDVEYEGG